MDDVSPSFLRLVALPFMGYVILEAGEEPGAKFSALGRQIAKGSPGHDAFGEEALCEVFGLFRRMALSAKEGVQRIPIGRA
jgi:hypothetical protein